MTYSVLDKDSLPGYLSKLDKAIEVLGSVDDIVISEIGDGNLNFVYRVSSASAPERSVIVKQAVPYLRMSGESWPLSKDRMKFEIAALRQYNELVPDFVPEIYHADEEMCVLVMRDLGAIKVLRYPMMEGNTFDKVGRDIGHFMAESLFRTSFLGMQSIERRRLMQKFTLNDDLCKLTEEFIFTFPYIDHESNYKNPPTNKHALEKLGGDPEYLRRVLRFKELFLSKTDALVHGDLHTGSIMVSADETYVIDMEFAFFGPFGFDVGKIIANFLMSYTSHFYRPGGPDYQKWILRQCREIWTVFEAQFLKLWDETPSSALIFEGLPHKEDLPEFKRRFMTNLFTDAVGFCACSLARRAVGIAGVADVRDVEDVEMRSKLECMNIDLSHTLMMQYESLDTIDKFLAAVEAFYAENAISKSGT